MDVQNGKKRMNRIKDLNIFSASMFKLSLFLLGLDQLRLWTFYDVSQTCRPAHLIGACLVKGLGLG
jgi:hypothetical protein